MTRLSLAALLTVGFVACAAGSDETGTSTGSGAVTNGSTSASGGASSVASSGGAATTDAATTATTNAGGSNSGGSNSGGANSGGANAGGTGGGGGSAPEDPPGVLAYERILNNAHLDDFHDVAWHPSGDFALILGTGGKVIRYDAAGGALTLVDTLGDGVAGLDVAEDGSFFFVVGTDASDSVMWRIAVDAGLALTITEELTFPFGEPRAIERNGDDVWAIGGYGTDSISYIFLWEAGMGLTVQQGFNASAGLTDIMWGDPAPLGSAVVHTGHGLNGADSRTYVVSSGMVVANNWSGGFGNAGGAGWRPGGTYGYFTGTSSNKLYVYDGSWSNITLPGVGTAASPQAVGWNATGTRALIVGRPIGPGLSATVIDHRAGSSAAFDSADLVNQSVPNFDQTPWFGTSGQYLRAIAWRPGTDCAEGLIVGNDNGTGQNPTFGLVVRYYDTGDPHCP